MFVSNLSWPAVIDPILDQLGTMARNALRVTDNRAESQLSLPQSTWKLRKYLLILFSVIQKNGRIWFYQLKNFSLSFIKNHPKNVWKNKNIRVFKF